MWILIILSIWRELCYLPTLIFCYMLWDLHVAVKCFEFHIINVNIRKMLLVITHLLKHLKRVLSAMYHSIAPDPAMFVDIRAFYDLQSILASPSMSSERAILLALGVNRSNP